MTSIQERIAGDMKEAMKSRDELRLSVLRMAQAAFHNKEIEKKGKGEPGRLIDEEVIAVLKSEMKKRKDAVGAFLKGGRTAAAEKEEKEMKILDAYLPAEMPDDDLFLLIEDLLKGMKPRPKEFGVVILEVMHKILWVRASYLSKHPQQAEQGRHPAFPREDMHPKSSSLSPLFPR